MPYVLKPNKLFARDPEHSDQYLPQNVVTDRLTGDLVAEINTAGAARLAEVNQAGTTHTDAVNTAGTAWKNDIISAGTAWKNDVIAAGTANVQAVQTKGTEVLNSIPDTYEDLSATSGALKSIVSTDLESAYLINVCGDERSSRTYKGVEITKQGNKFLLNGTATGTMRGKISGAIDYQTYAQEAWKQERLGLQIGKKYKTSITFVSGSITSGGLSVVVADHTGAELQATRPLATDNVQPHTIIYSNEFESTQAKTAAYVFFYFGSGTSFSNLVIQISFVCIDDIRNDLGILSDIEHSAAKFNFARDVVTIETENLLSFSTESIQRLVDNGAESVKLINSNELNFTYVKPAGTTLRMGLVSKTDDNAFDYQVFNPQLPAGTYTLFYHVEHPASNSDVRFRHREIGGVNGANIEPGVAFTVENETEIYVTLTSGNDTASYTDTTIRFALYDGEIDEERYIPRITARDYYNEEINNTIKEQVVEESSVNLFSFSRNMQDNPELNISFVNNSEIIISGTKTESKTFRYAMGNIPFNYKTFNPNLPAGTYRVSHVAFATDGSTGELRVRYRTEGNVNGDNFTDGVYTFANPVEVYVAIPSGFTDFVDYHVRWQITPGSDVVDFVPGGISAIDSKARALIEQRVFSNLENSYDSARITVNKQRQPGDLLFTVGSDYHFANTQIERDALSKYIAFCKSMAIDYMLELGDNVRGYDSDADSPDLTRGYTSTLNSILRNADRSLLYIIGNHDDASGYVKTHSQSADDFISDNELRNYYILNCDPKITKTNHLYYYADNDEYKIRIVALNSQDIPKVNDPTTGKAKYYAQNDYGFRAEQITWLKETLENVPNNYAVVVLVHHPITGQETNFDVVKSLIAACHHGTSYTSSGSVEDFAYSVQADFTGNEKKVLCVLCGHTHQSAIVNLETGDAYTGSAITASGIPMIVQISGEDNQNALIVNRNQILRIGLKTAEVTSIDISNT